MPPQKCLQLEGTHNDDLLQSLELTTSYQVPAELVQFLPTMLPLIISLTSLNLSDQPTSQLKQIRKYEFPEGRNFYRSNNPNNIIVQNLVFMKTNSFVRELYEFNPSEVQPSKIDISTSPDNLLFIDEDRKPHYFNWDSTPIERPSANNGVLCSPSLDGSTFAPFVTRLSSLSWQLFVPYSINRWDYEPTAKKISFIGSRIHSKEVMSEDDSFRWASSKDDSIQRESKVEHLLHVFAIDSQNSVTKRSIELPAHQYISEYFLQFKGANEVVLSIQFFESEPIPGGYQSPKSTILYLIDLTKGTSQPLLQQSGTTSNGRFGISANGKYLLFQDSQATVQMYEFMETTPSDQPYTESKQTPYQLPPRSSDR